MVAMAIKCINDSIRYWLHTDIYFLSVRPVFTNIEIVLKRILKSEIKIFRKLDLGNLSVGNNGDEAVAAVVDGRW